MKFLITILLSFTFIAAYSQNTGIIRGKITTSDGLPAQYISVTIKGIDRGTTTNEIGQYTIRGIKPGKQTIVVSAIGIERTEKEIMVKLGENRLSLIIDISQQQLKEVTISSEKTNKFNIKQSESVARMPLTNLENPQVYTTISQQLLKEQVITNFNDALKNTSGLDKLWSSTGRGDDGAAYYSLRGFTIQPTLIDGIAGLTNGDLDPSNMEKIEVIKGPSGTLFGGALTNFGGLINIITKKPLDTLGGEIAYTTGSYNLSRLTADVYSPVNKSKTLLARVNAAYHYQNSFQDVGFRKSTFIAPAIEYRISDKTKFNVGAEFYQYEGTNPLMVFLNRSRQLIAKTPAQLNFDFHHSYTSNDITVKTPTINIHGLLSHKLSNNWTSQTSFSRSYRKSEGIYQYVMYLGATDDLLSRYANIQNSASSSTDFQQNFIGDFTLAGLRNRMVIGLDYLNQYTNNSNSPYIEFDKVSSIGTPANYLNLTRTAVETRIGASTSAPDKNSTNSNVYSTYVSDVLNVTNNLIAMLSVRIDRFDNKGTYDQITGNVTDGYLQTAISPKFGVVYQPIKDKVSIFGNYMNGFRNVAPVTQPLADISGTFKPQQANQIEGGVKLDVFHNHLSLTASYYDISVTNITRGESIERGGTTYNITVQDGTQKSKGFEFDMIANPVLGLNLIAGYSHNDSKMTKSAASVLGLRPVSAGPEDMVNFWGSYSFQNGRAKGLGLGFGGNYSSKNLITNTTVTGAFTLPSYTVLNATAFYNTNKYRVALKLDNIADKDYFKGWTTVEIQQPRTISANLALKF